MAIEILSNHSFASGEEVHHHEHSRGLKNALKPNSKHQRESNGMTGCRLRELVTDLFLKCLDCEV